MIRLTQIFWLDSGEYGRNVLGWRIDIFYPHYSFENRGRLTVSHSNGNNARAVDEVDASHQRNVLPHFCLAGNGGDCADLLLLECVDDARLARVGVADKADRDLLLVRVQYAELTEQLNQRPFSKGIIDGSVKRNRGRFLGKDLDPSSLAKGKEQAV